MSDIEIGRLGYLGLLLTALVLWMFVQHRGRLVQKLQQLAAWGLIFLAVIAAIGLWDDIRHTVAPQQSVFADQGRIELPRAPDGHYYMTLLINGTPVNFVVDTGATGMVLTRQDAERVGITPDDLAFHASARTANGAVETAPVRLDRVALGAIEDRNLPAFVNGGEMDNSLLGMSYLQRFDRLEISGGKMVLERR
ncbi:retropepsin-like aspartic protease family protein [Salipiger mangrovisoli]|uniref:TIGR02281 family clan AA aspartic protease n=1 Tax=Salipiger mangrovisoli TaxID=2865933 RepID=A0ABR9WWM6_9RHOB|nr:TIGR02281 family clan AA aspartic protease [Salipiger mangrovisoli]MBE9635693.1 TIGR02281 family clan AA aspartic protease [Salipiger mangrovisoli]